MSCAGSILKSRNVRDCTWISIIHYRGRPAVQARLTSIMLVGAAALLVPLFAIDEFHPRLFEGRRIA
jgi:hypothetical protein